VIDDRWWCVEDAGDGLLAASPMSDPEGRSIMVGLTLLTDLDGLKVRGAELVVQVDDMYEFANPRVLWMKGGAETISS
jgi:hypothetical protein